MNKSKLNLILGRSGSGKSFYIREMIKNLCSKNSKIMLIVPEQDSFETEKLMLELLGAEDSNKILVTSFKRLVDFVFRRVGGKSLPKLNESSRNIFMHLAIDEVREFMEIYSESNNTNETTNIMITALKEFKINGISTDEILKKSENIEDQVLKSKIKDTALILDAYESLIESSYIEPLDDLTNLSKQISENDIFRGYKVFIDEFDGFTPQEILVLNQILSQCDESFIALRSDTLNLSDNGMNLFSPVLRTIKKLVDFSKQNGVALNNPKIMSHQYRFKSGELKKLEKNIFRAKSEKIYGNVKDICIYSASDPYEEINFVANTIKKMVMENHYEYNDFAIIARDLNKYESIIISEFSKHDVPHFIDVKQNIDSKPIMCAITSLFDVINSNLSSKHIFRYLKTGMSNISFEDISVIENYVMLWNIDNKEWLKEFTLNPSGFSANISDNDQELLKKINEIREKIISPILEFKHSIKSKTPSNITKSIYKFLINTEAPKKTLELSQKLKGSGKHTLAEEQLRLWDLLIDILDQMYLILKDKNIDPRKYSEILKLVLNSEKIAFIPQNLDEVIIGDADRIRLKNKKIVFLIGAYEGEFPRLPVSSGVFSDSERKLLISLGVPMYESLENLIIEERFLAYTSTSSASEKLFLSYPMSLTSGENNYPSSIIRETKKIFPNIHIKDKYSLDEDYCAYSKASTFELCAKNWNNSSTFSESLKYYFLGDKEYKLKMQALIKSSSDLTAFKFNDQNEAKKLFGKEMMISASQMEKFYLCRFNYFCKYGLKAKEQKSYSFDSLEYGKLVHYLLEDILSKNPVKYLLSASKTEIKDIIDKSFAKYIEKNLNCFEEKTRRFKYLFYRVKNVILILINHLREEFSQSEFVPSEFEIEISENSKIKPLLLKTPNGNAIKIKGKIDRLDIMKKNGKSYIRVVDYKTGVKEFNLSDIVYGLNTQMLIYLMTVCKNGKDSYGNIVPAGILYMPSNKPLINASRNAKIDKINSEINKKLRMNGLLTDDSEIIKGMEKDARGTFIPVSLSDDKINKSENAATIPQIELIMKYLEKLIISMADTLNCGDIAANPAIGEYDACKYCEYKTVCGRENSSSGRLIKKLSKEETIYRIEKSVGEYYA